MQKIVFLLNMNNKKSAVPIKKLIEVSCEQEKKQFLRFSSVDNEVFKFLA